MLKRLSLIALVVLGSLSAPSAQVSGVALAALGEGSVFDGFFGPWRITPTGIDIQYWILCYDVAERRKVAGAVNVAVPDGSSLADIRILATTGIVDACAAQGISVNRGAVILPAVQLGQ